MTDYPQGSQTEKAAPTEAPTNPGGSITSRLDGTPLSGILSASDGSTGLHRNKPKIGVLGHLGSIGSRHLKNFKELGCNVDGWDPLKNHPLDRASLIAWADAIVVATPTEQHFVDLITIPMDKFIFVEKPIVARREQIPEKLNEDNILMVGYNLRFHSCVKKAREWLGKGVIGKPVWARFTCAQYNDKPSYLRDGVILNWSHEIDLALYLLGPAELMGATDSGSNLADLTVFHTPIGCQTTIHLDYLTKYERRSFLIVGTEGSIEADLVGRQALHLDNSGVVIERFGGRDSFDGNYLDEARCFLKRLEGEETLGCTAAEAMKVVELCLQAKEYVRGR